MLEVAGYGAPLHRPSAMHDAAAMSAAQGARGSPSSSLQPLAQGLQGLQQHTSVIKKLDHSVDSFIPSTRHENQSFDVMDHSGRPTFHSNVNPTFTDDDFSDHDSHYSEDFEDDDDDADIEEYEPEPRPDMTKQLLGFATMVSTDIQKFFGRKKGEDDACDIYEDKWVSTKSGRELYYADLMKIVHGEDGKGGKSKKGSASPFLDISNSVPEHIDNRQSFSGKLDKKLGIGGLNELFEYGLRHYLTDKKLKQSKELKRLKTDPKKFENVAPMNSRKLPSSFWTEPGAKSRTSTSNSVLQNNNPPDFSDLLESWRLDRNEFSGEISSSEVSMSPESV
ncbi:protein PERCC1-like [Mya arenaria]|uniref:protein PERCC1-like n=1 Tax=Mya arenaria TaxID=6604 RepID=UPI0022E76527|nr:protein PERCC1-like [Mya arenaria]